MGPNRPVPPEAFFSRISSVPSPRWQARQHHSGRYDYLQLSPSHCWELEKLKNFLALNHVRRCTDLRPKELGHHNGVREPWENALNSPPENKSLKRLYSAFFQDANYHDQIVKEQNEPAVQEAPSARDPVLSRRHPLLDTDSRHCRGQRFVPEDRSGPQPTTNGHVPT